MLQCDDDLAPQPQQQPPAHGSIVYADKRLGPIVNHDAVLSLGKTFSSKIFELLPNQLVNVPRIAGLEFITGCVQYYKNERSHYIAGKDDCVNWNVFRSLRDHYCLVLASDAFGCIRHVLNTAPGSVSYYSGPLIRSNNLRGPIGVAKPPRSDFGCCMGQCCLLLLFYAPCA